MCWAGKVKKRRASAAFSEILGHERFEEFPRGGDAARGGDGRFTGIDKAVAAGGAGSTAGGNHHCAGVMENIKQTFACHAPRRIFRARHHDFDELLIQKIINQGHKDFWSLDLRAMSAIGNFHEFCASNSLGQLAGKRRGRSHIKGAGHDQGRVANARQDMLKIKVGQGQACAAK